MLLLLWCIPLHTSKGYDRTESMEVIAQVLMDPLIYAVPALMPVAKLVPVLLIVGVMVVGNRMRRLFNGYVALLYVALAFFQTTAVTERYGFVVISGNLAVVLVVGAVWAWEAIVGRNDFAARERPPWKWWVAPLALVALLAPVGSGSLSPDFSPGVLLANESGLTYCMMTPVILAVLTLFYPTVNLAVLRVSSFVGIIFGVVNLVTWFLVMPEGWWMGVLHIPLLAISIYAFVLGHTRVEARAEETGI